jgi:hypothetical protein
MKVNNTSQFYQFIKDQYAMENMSEYQEASTRSITITFSAENACMFAAIAKRFGKSTSAFGGDVFEPAVQEMFQALDPQDRMTVATESDVELTRYLKSKGITSTDSEGGEESMTWRRYAAVLNRVDQEQK